MVNAYDLNFVTFRAYGESEGYLGVMVKDKIFIMKDGNFYEAPAGQYKTEVQTLKAKFDEDGCLEYMGNKIVDITNAYFGLSRSYLQGYATMLETGRDTDKEYVYLRVQRPGGIIYNVIQVGKNFILGFNEAADEREGKFYTKGFLLRSLEDVETAIECRANKTEGRVEAEMKEFEIS